MSRMGLKPLDTPAVESSTAQDSASPILPVNPWLALAVALVRPLASLFRRRPQPPLAVQRLKMESYSRTPVQAAPEAVSKASATQQQVISKAPAPAPTPDAGRKGGRHHG